MGMHDTSLSFGLQAKSFTDALTGANKKQGNWGESILGQVLENCGLKEGTHFVAQTGSGGGMPDYQVFDPCTQKVLNVAVTEPSGQCIKGPAQEVIRLGGRPKKGLKSKTLREETQESAADPEAEELLAEGEC